jgi:hypothetical protein
VQKRRLLDALGALVESGEVVREGENRETRFRLATPEDRAAQAAQAVPAEAPPEPQDDPYSQENIDRLVRAAQARWLEERPDLKRLLEERGKL